MNSRQLADRIGNVDDRLVQQAENTPNYGRQNRRRGLRRLVTAAAAAALMIASFTVGALAFSTERIVEVPTEKIVEVFAQREIIELDKLGLTLILPDSWAGQYELIPWEETYVMVCPEVRQAVLAQARQEYEDVGTEWPEELDRDPFAGGMLFYIVEIPEVLTPEQVEMFWSFTENRYLFATAECTYILYYASDVQCTGDTREQYQAMKESIRDIQIILNNVLN